MSLTLTPAELEDLTGYKRPSKQKESLEFMGLAYFVNGAGEIKVLRSTVEGSTNDEEPDYDAA